MDTRAPKQATLSAVLRVLGLLSLGVTLVVPWESRAAESSLTNGIGMTFVLIPEGTFSMGSADADRSGRASAQA